MKTPLETIIRQLEPVARSLEALIVPLANGNRDSHGKPLMPEAEARRRLKELLGDMQRVAKEVEGIL
mgnify:FL=1|jgi:hypothetical protein